MEKCWYVFLASGQEALFGFGLEYSADFYADMLNQGRSSDFYSHRAAAPDEVAIAELLGFNLEDETHFLSN